jgi:hypothetical protein
MHIAQLYSKVERWMHIAQLYSKVERWEIVVSNMKNAHFGGRNYA